MTGSVFWDISKGGDEEGAIVSLRLGKETGAGEDEEGRQGGEGEEGDKPSR